MKFTNHAKTLKWLKSNPSLDELCLKYPKQWVVVQQEISAIVERGVAEELKNYLQGLSTPLETPSHDKQQQISDTALLQFIRNRMAHESIKKLCLATLASNVGARKGKLRFNFINGFIAQKLLFRRGLERKPASMFWFRLLWPLVWQRKRLLPLVQPRGIYCFYSRALIEALSTLIASRICIEIAAGDGILTRFLSEQGVQISASDNHGWNKSIQYPDWVIKLDAREALASYTPEVVICSWPPSQNDFERYVFDTPSVQLYIVIGSRHQFAFGNWKDYQRQATFELQENQELAELVLPPELETAVLVFKRKTSVSQNS